MFHKCIGINSNLWTVSKYGETITTSCFGMCLAGGTPARFAGPSFKCISIAMFLDVFGAMMIKKTIGLQRGLHKKTVGLHGFSPYFCRCVPNVAHYRI